MCAPNLTNWTCSILWSHQHWSMYSCWSYNNGTRKSILKFVNQRKRQNRHPFSTSHGFPYGKAYLPTRTTLNRATQTMDSTTRPPIEEIENTDHLRGHFYFGLIRWRSAQGRERVNSLNHFSGFLVFPKMALVKSPNFLWHLPKTYCLRPSFPHPASTWYCLNWSIWPARWDVSPWSRYGCT